MTTFTIHLPQHQARLVALAVHYHLSRPGSEIDRDTMHEYAHGLAEVLPIIDGQIEEDSRRDRPQPLQTILLSTAFSSVISASSRCTPSSTPCPARAAVPAPSRPASTTACAGSSRRSPATRRTPGQLAEDLTMLRRELPSQRAKELVDAQRQAVIEARSRTQALAVLEKGLNSLDWVTRRRYSLVGVRITHIYAVNCWKRA